MGWFIFLLLFAYIIPVLLGYSRWGFPRPYFWRGRGNHQLGDAGWSWFADFVWVSVILLTVLLLIVVFWMTRAGDTCPRLSDALPLKL